jgi:hypothetical protein
MTDIRVDTIYVELDVLLDTRLGTLAVISDELAERVLSNGYHARDNDIFEGVEPCVFKDMYAKRDWETLAKSLMSGAVIMLYDIAGKLLKQQSSNQPYQGGVKIVVNTHPYSLTDEELHELGRSVAAWMHGIASVELITSSTKELTPLHCKTSYKIMFMYEGLEWMEMHSKLFRQTRLPEVLLFVPALYHNKTPTETELKQQIKQSAHPAQALEFFAKPIIELKMIDPLYFSVVKPN